MARYRRRTTVSAPLEAVWEFHTDVQGLVEVTPEWMRLRVESVRGPTGDRDRTVLETGAEVTLSVRPFGVGPRQSWTSRIVERERRDDVAWFRDRMIDGPFPRWVHSHRFEAVRAGTSMTDLVHYELPNVPRPLSGVGWPCLEPLFAYRHRRTRDVLESGGRPSEAEEPA